MKTYYVSIPCYVTEERPEVTLTPNRVCHVPVTADSEREAIELVGSWLTALIRGSVGGAQRGTGHE